MILIAWADGYVLAWYLAQRECTAAWAALMARMPAPKMVVSDGSPGLAKAASLVWKGTRIQRCTFHAASQVRRYTTLKPKLEAGVELLGIANQLTHIRDPESAAQWLVDYITWYVRRETFLKEFTFKEGRRIYTHERLRRARKSLNKLVREGRSLPSLRCKRAMKGYDLPPTMPWKA